MRASPWTAGGRCNCLRNWGRVVPDFLEQMAQGSRRRLAELPALPVLRRLAQAAQAPRPARIKAEHFTVIAEFKRESPSQGRLGAGASPAQTAREYEAAGAVAISVLTEPSRFAGSLEDLREARAAVGTPVMRKDFLVAPAQVLEARAAGADGVLLIVRMLSDAELREMQALAAELGMFALVEAFDERDLERAQRSGAGLVGVNCRDLGDLSVDVARFERLRGCFAPGVTRVAESGLRSADDLRRVAALGYHAALVGTALMQGAPLSGLLAELQP
ncbi:MAG: indole-3-glycerol-phosphate synthase [Planctomycetes bacterium]|nr:indole-3-glycerol-phosphate synthase [Planctomycetota bacterium]